MTDTKSLWNSLEPLDPEQVKAAVKAAGETIHSFFGMGGCDLQVADVLADIDRSGARVGSREVASMRLGMQLDHEIAVIDRHDCIVMIEVKLADLEPAAPKRTAILIDPSARTVTEVDYDGSADRFQALTGGERIAATPVINSFPGSGYDEDGYFIEGNSTLGAYAFEDSILANDDAMMQDDCCFFRFPLYPDPVAGPALIAGVDEDGKSCAPGVTVEQIAELVQFKGFDIS